MALFKKLGGSRIEGLYTKQRSLGTMPDMLLPTSKSPTRFEIQLEAMKLMEEGNDIVMPNTFPAKRMLSIMKNINLSVDSLDKNPIGPIPRCWSIRVCQVTKRPHLSTYGCAL